MLIPRLRYWLHWAKRRDALRTEMELHIEEKAADLIEKGLSESEARAEAQRHFGNILLKQEAAHEIWVTRYWSDFWQDVRHGARSLRRNPIVAAVAVVSAGLGIGACTTIFSIVNFAVFRPLAVEEPERLMSITAMRQKEAIGGQTLSFPELRDLRSDTRSWMGVAAFAPLLPAALRAHEGEARRYTGVLVTANYFDVVKPGFTIGGGFVPEEDDRNGANPKIVLTNEVWVNQFGADPTIVGRTILVNKRNMTVTGVTHAGFRGTEVGISADFFLPFSQISEMRRLGDDPKRMESYGAQWLMGLGRLQPDMDKRLVQAGLDLAARKMRERVPQMASDRGFHAEPAGQLLPSIRKQAIPALVLLFLITILVLLTACANIANLMLAKALTQSKEVAIRFAIGAGRGRLVRQLMTESLLVSTGGGVLGILLTALVSRYIAGFRLPLPIPIDLRIPIDFHVLVFSAVLSVLTGLTFGLIPAFRASRLDLMGTMRSGEDMNTSLRRFGLRTALVVGQVAISAALMICAGLFLRSLQAARRIDTGMNTKNVALIGFDPSLIRYDELRTRALLLDALRDIQAMSGVQSASVTNMLPLSLGGSFTNVSSGGSANPGDGERTAVMSIAPRYFDSMGIPLLSGGDFTQAPSEEPIVIVNQELAHKLFPGQDVIGRHIVDDRKVQARIVAVAANSKYDMALQSDVTPILYRPILDTPAGRRSLAGLTLIIRSTQEPGALGNATRRMLLNRDPELVVSLLGTMDSHLQESLFVPHLAASLVGLCGGIGLLIASIGVYGVIAFSVARRSHEIGIRMALGARSWQVVRMILWHGSTVALVGIAIGTTGGLMLAHAARSLIYGVSQTDPATFIAVPTLLLFVVLIAALIPACRAARVDPNRTLRAD